MVYIVLIFIFLQISVKLLRRGTTQEGELFQVGEAIIQKFSNKIWTPGDAWVENMPRDIGR